VENTKEKFQRGRHGSRGPQRKRNFKSTVSGKKSGKGGGKRIKKEEGVKEDREKGEIPEGRWVVQSDPRQTH